MRAIPIVALVLMACWPEPPEIAAPAPVVQRFYSPPLTMPGQRQFRLRVGVNWHDCVEWDTSGVVCVYCSTDGVHLALWCHEPGPQSVSARQ